MCHLTCEEMWHSLIYDRPHPFTGKEPTEAEKARATELRLIIKLFAEIAYLPWSTDCDTNTAEQKSRKYRFGDTDILNESMPPVSNVTWKAFLLLAIDSCDSEDLVQARLRGRASAAIHPILRTRRNRMTTTSQPALAQRTSPLHVRGRRLRSPTTQKLLVPLVSDLLHLWLCRYRRTAQEQSRSIDL